MGPRRLLAVATLFLGSGCAAVQAMCGDGCNEPRKPPTTIVERARERLACRSVTVKEQSFSTRDAPQTSHTWWLVTGCGRQHVYVECDVNHEVEGDRFDPAHPEELCR